MVQSSPKPENDLLSPDTENASPELLMKAYQPLVGAIARRLHDSLPYWVELDDLIQAGRIGLFQAVSRYNEHRNVRFSTFAKFRIRGAMLDELRELDWISRDARTETRRLEAIRMEFEIANGRPATEAEFAEALGVTLDHFRKRRRLIPPTLVSLSGRAPDEREPEWNVVDDQPNPFDMAMDGEVRDCVSNALRQLPERERFVIYSHYWESRGLAEIADEIGVNESRVFQIRKQAIARLKAYLQDKGVSNTV